MKNKPMIEIYQEANYEPTVIEGGRILYLKITPVKKSDKLSLSRVSWKKIEESFLISCMFDEDEGVVKVGKDDKKSMTLFEICVYSDCKKDLDDLFDRKKRELACSFAEKSHCPKVVLITASVPSVFPTKKDKKNNHKGKWQKFALFRMGGGK